MNYSFRTRRRSAGFLLRSIISPTAALLLSAPLAFTSALAKETLQQFDIQSLPLSQTLLGLSRQSGKIITLPNNIGEGITAPAVVGEMSLPDALAQVLDGTGLVFEQSSENSYVVKSQGAAVEKGVGVKKENDDRKQVIEEMVVTATKRETSLQSTAMSISALLGSEMEERGDVSLADIAESVPGITLQEYGPGERYVTFRGISASSTAFNNSTATTAFLGDVPFTGQTFGPGDIRLVDMARVELLKGPQGTLFGKSAVGGALRYIPNDPTTEDVEAGYQIYSSSTADSDDTNWGGHGYLNLPVSDVLALRGVFYKYDNAGFIDNLGTNTKDVNTEDTVGGRLAMRWNVTDRTDLDVLYFTHKTTALGGQNAGIQSIASVYSPTPHDASAPFALPDNVMDPDVNNPSYYTNFNAISTNRYEGVQVKLGTDFDLLRLDLIAGYQKRRWISESDVINYLWVFDGSTTAIQRHDRKVTGQTLELRLTSNSDTAVDWIVGLWYENEKMDGDTLGYVRDSLNPLVFGTVLWDEGHRFFDYTLDSSLTEIAGFAELGLQLSDQLRISGGLRYSSLKRDTDILTASGSLDGTTNSLIGVDQSSRETPDTYRATIEYTVSDDLFLYALVSSGYRIGGFNSGNAINGIPPSTYTSDSVWNYEGGVKMTWLDGRATTNATVYYIDWSDMQLTVIEKGIIAGTRNVGNAEVSGLEFESRFDVTEHLTLSANYSYIDAKFAEAYLRDPTDPETLQARKGQRLPGSAKQSFSVLADWVYPAFTWGDMLVGADYRYIGDRVSEIGTNPSLLPSYQLVNARIGVSIHDGPNVTLFADNLFDERTLQSTEIGVGPLKSFVVNRPRVIGLRLTQKF